MPLKSLIISDQGLAEDSNKQTEKYEEGAGRKTPMSLSACSNCMYNRNGTCCGASCCPAGSLCCTSAYSSASSCCDVSKLISSCKMQY